MVPSKASIRNAVKIFPFNCFNKPKPRHMNWKWHTPSNQTSPNISLCQINFISGQISFAFLMIFFSIVYWHELYYYLSEKNFVGSIEINAWLETLHTSSIQNFPLKFMTFLTKFLIFFLLLPMLLSRSRPTRDFSVCILFECRFSPSHPWRLFPILALKWERDAMYTVLCGAMVGVCLWGGGSGGWLVGGGG